MSKVMLFFGSDTGYTADVAEKIRQVWGGDEVAIKDIVDAGVEDFEKPTKIIIGSSTWHDGQLVSGWDMFIDELDEVDFSGKKVAIYGLGDQIGYADWFCTAIGILGKKVQERGATLIGSWPNDGYEFEDSEGFADGKWMGLPLDETNQSELTDGRLEKWIAQIKKEFEE